MSFDIRAYLQLELKKRINKLKGSVARQDPHNETELSRLNKRTASA
jgi:hypothetical protein